MQEMKLVFDNLPIDICLTGDGYGAKVCREQIIGKIDLNKPFILEFPESIKVLSPHFFSSMIKEMLENPDINIDIIRKNITIKGDKRLVKVFDKTIRNYLSDHDRLIIKDLCIHLKNRDILQEERELSKIRTEKLAIFKGSIHFDNEEDKMKRLFELDEVEKEKINEIDLLVKERSNICQQTENYI